MYNHPPQTPLTRRHCCGLGLATGLGWLGLGGVRAQDRLLRIGETKIASHAALDADEKGFAAGLANAGFKAGVNVTDLRRNAGGDMAQAEAIAHELVQAKVDLIHAIATPTAQAVMRTDSRRPLVFSSVTDPVRAQGIALSANVLTKADKIIHQARPQGSAQHAQHVQHAHLCA